jgi:hypothetical protein
LAGDRGRIVWRRKAIEEESVNCEESLADAERLHIFPKEDGRMRNAHVLSVIEGIALLLFLFCVSVGCKPSGPPSYINFCWHRSDTYYSNFTVACSQLMTNVGGHGTNEIRLAGDDIRLPILLQEMHATYVNVTPSNVWLIVDISAGYGVVWHEDDFNSNVWKLTVRSEAEPKDVFVRTNK